MKYHIVQKGPLFFPQYKYKYWPFWLYFKPENKFQKVGRFSTEWEASCRIKSDANTRKRQADAKVVKKIIPLDPFKEEKKG